MTNEIVATAAPMLRSCQMTSELAAESIEETGDLPEADVVVVRGIGVEKARTL